MEIKPQDVQKYCEKTRNKILIHGSVSSYADDIAKDGLLIRSKDFPTVLFADHGRYREGFEWKPAIEYTWHEPRSNGEDVCVVIEVPKEVFEMLDEKGLPITQKNVFDVICEEIELTVPDNEETRQAYKDCQKEKSNPSASKLGGLFEGVVGQKFSEYGAKPGTKYTHIGVPPKYIVAITSADKVYYASEKVESFAKRNDREK